MSKPGLRKSLLVALLTGSALSPAFAQDTAPPAGAETRAPADGGAEPLAGDEEDDFEGEAIVVTGTRRPERGAVPGVEPELQLDPRDIRTYGAGNLDELLEALSPQTASGRGRGDGRPVVLLNGRRISSFSEIRRIPPEALLRVDVLPEEAALQFGYRADQRVVNFVLRPRFRAITTEAQHGFATDGGRPSFGAEADLLRINRNGRWSIGLEYSRSDALLETERDLPDPFRTLLPATEEAEINGSYSRAFGDAVTATLTGELEHNKSDGRLGLAPDAGFGFARPLQRESDSWSGELGLSLNGDLSDWRWSLTSNYQRRRTVSLTDDRTNAFAVRDRSESRSETANAQLLFGGPTVRLPAGEVRTSLTAGAERLGLAGKSFRSGLFQARELSRECVYGQATLDVPLASRDRGFLGGIGDLSANLNGRIEHLSDFGTLTTLGYGLNWSPIDTINLRASVTHEAGAPSVQQLGDPATATSGVRVLDFVRGETVDITRIDGGNPNLRADDRRVFSLGTRIRPLSGEDLVVTAEYTDTRIRNPIASFPTATAEIEAAFPDRFVRNASGQLVSIDARPVNFASSEQEQLRWGVNYSRRLGPPPPPRGERRGRRGEGAAGEGSPEGAGAEGSRREGRGFGRRGFGGRGFGGRGGRGGRLQLSAYHTVRFEDRVVIREGLPPLDFLNGSAAGNRGGRPRHEVEVGSGATLNGFGGRLAVNWQSGTIVRNAGGGDLDFSPTTMVNLRLFANLGQQRKLVEAVPFLRGSRLSLVVDNLFDSRPRVRDAFGEIPLAYRGAYLNPLGRSIRLSFRKQFF